MLKRKIAVMLFSGAALAAQAGLAAAEENLIEEFWAKNPRNVAPEVVAKGSQKRAQEQTAVTAEKQTAQQGITSGEGEPVLFNHTDTDDAFYYKQAGGVPPA